MNFLQDLYLKGGLSALAQLSCYDGNGLKPLNLHCLTDSSEGSFSRIHIEFSHFKYYGASVVTINCEFFFLNQQSRNKDEKFQFKLKGIVFVSPKKKILIYSPLRVFDIKFQRIYLENSISHQNVHRIQKWVMVKCFVLR